MRIFANCKITQLIQSLNKMKINKNCTKTNKEDEFIKLIDIAPHKSFRCTFNKKFANWFIAKLNVY